MRFQGTIGDLFRETHVSEDGQRDVDSLCKEWRKALAPRIGDLPIVGADRIGSTFLDDDAIVCLLGRFDGGSVTLDALGVLVVARSTARTSVRVLCMNCLLMVATWPDDV